MGSLSDIWAKIVAQLTPMGTQVLMRQHGHLLACDGVEANVGITNDKLMRMAQDRLSNVEIAFEKVFGYKLRVTMVVAQSDNVAAPPPVAPSPAAIPPPSRPPAPQVKPAPPKQNAAPSSRSPNPAAPAPPAAPSAPASPEAAPPANAAGWQAESDLDRSVKSFAQFFSGQIVNLDDEPSDSLESPTKGAPPSTEPGPDVPF